MRGTGVGERGRGTRSAGVRCQAHDAAGTPRYAAIDLGTHNCRMLVAEPRPGDGLRIIEAMSRPVRLGEGLAARGALGEQPMARAIEALGACVARLRALHVRRVHAIATEACRRAANAAAFVARTEAATGLELRIISPEEEAALTLKGCAGLLDRRAPMALMFDIGGGSTEVMAVCRDHRQAPRPVAMVSLPVGVVGLAERFGGDRVGSEAYRAMVSDVEDRLAGAAASLLPDGAAIAGRTQMLGTSGTVTTLAALHLGLGAYDRHRVDGTEIGFDAISALSARLRELDFRGRAAVACIGPNRADLVVAGCAILEAICRRWPVGRLTVADRGIREGVLLTLMAEDGYGGGDRADGGRIEGR